jgi:hypothetical protein
MTYKTRHNQIMDYKKIIKEYIDYTKGNAQRCEMLFEAFGDVPEPTEEEMILISEEAQEDLKERANPEINLICTALYVQYKYQQLKREEAHGNS